MNIGQSNELDQWDHQYIREPNFHSVGANISRKLYTELTAFKTNADLIPR